VVALVSLRSYWRFLVVVRQFLPLVLGYVRDRRRFFIVGGRRRVSSETRRRRAERLLDSLLTLGPTFIKLGQLLSTRPDVLPPEYVDVLTQLQDQVPPARWPAARVVIEEELGPVEGHFDAFETEAISGASLGQVYRAEIDGEQVAVKVRRPGIEALVEADLRVVRWLLPLVVRFVDDSRAFSLSNLADEFAKTIQEEMDYEREARMLTEIRGNFADDPRVRMPTVVESHSTGRVLTMEYVPGTRVTDVEAIDEMGLDRRDLAETIQRAYLQMIVEDGVFHGDPHPGNLAVQPDGTVVFYDFGMSGHVPPYVQERIVDFYLSVANRDIEGILDALIAIGTLSPDADRDTMGRIMELAIEDARGRDIEHYRVQRIVQQVEDTIYDFPFRLPRNLALILRVATVVEGVCVTLDEDFDFIRVATDFLTERGYREESAQQFVAELRDDVVEAAQASVRVPQTLERTLNRAERGNLRVQSELQDPHDVLDRLARRLVAGFVLASTILATAYLYPIDPRVAAAPAALGVLSALLLYRSFRQRRGLRAQPQFTRQAMRERRQDEEGE